ncbi:MAG: hypothetical protein WDO73_22625 [Ignavibacteriota bacterium]
MAQTLFDAGRRRAASESALASYDAAVAAYRQTVLAAFQQVEDNLVALRSWSARRNNSRRPQRRLANRWSWSRIAIARAPIRICKCSRRRPLRWRTSATTSIS